MKKTHLQSLIFALLLLYFATNSTPAQTRGIVAIAKLPQAPIVQARPPVETASVFSVQEKGTRYSVPSSLNTKNSGTIFSQLSSAKPIAVSPQVKPSEIVSPVPVRRANTTSSQGEIMTLKELGASEWLIEKNPEKRWPLASLTKLMTALVAAELIDPADTVTLTDAALKTEGWAGGFSAGETFTVSDLTRAMLVASSNDAAEAIAQYYGRDKFMDAMQAKVSELGLSQTTFFDPSGLSSLNQSSASDLEHLIAYIVEKKPELMHYTRQRIATITEQRKQKTRQIISTHSFVAKPDFIGGKTGFTEFSKGNLLSLFQENGKIYFALVMGSLHRSDDMNLLYDTLRNN